MDTLSQELQWSRSKMSALKECARKWHFSYKTPSLPEVERLKKIKNRHLWAGSMVHDAVARVIQGLSQQVDVPPLETLLQETQEAMRKQFLKSKNNEPSAEEGKVAFRLLEHELNQVIAPAAWKELWGKVEKSLRWFMTSSWFERLKALEPHHWKTVNEVLSFNIDAVKTFVKIDCAIEVNDRFFLMDWKTSALSTDPSKPNEGLLLGALYATEVWGADAENITLNEISLVDGKSRQLPLLVDDLMDLTLRIQEEATAAQESTAAFPPDVFSLPFTSNRRLCEQCSFKPLCFPSNS